MNKNNDNDSEYDLDNDLANIKAAFSNIKRDIKGKGSELYGQSIDNFKEKSQDIQTDLGRYVTKEPIKSLGIVFAIGVVLGFLLRK